MRFHHECKSKIREWADDDSVSPDVYETIFRYINVTDNLLKQIQQLEVGLQKLARYSSHISGEVARKTLEKQEVLKQELHKL